MLANYDHIAVFLVTCGNDCFPPHPLRAPRDQDAVLAMRAGLDKRRCKQCGDRVSVEALWAGQDGRLPYGAPAVAKQALKGV